MRSALTFAFWVWSTMFDTSASGVTNRWVMNRNVTNVPTVSVPVSGPGAVPVKIQ